MESRRATLGASCLPRPSWSRPSPPLARGTGWAAGRRELCWCYVHAVLMLCCAALRCRYVIVGVPSEPYEIHASPFIFSEQSGS